MKNTNKYILFLAFSIYDSLVRPVTLYTIQYNLNDQFRNEDICLHKFVTLVNYHLMSLF
jgi:hypothetical protein